MPLYRILEHFEAAAGRCRTPADLLALTEAAAREVGFERLAIMHGLWFRAPQSRLIRLDNYGAYADHFIERRYYIDDPVPLAGQRTGTTFTWDQLPRLIPWRKRHGEIMDDAGRHGLRGGMTVPVNVVGEPPGTCSFATANGALPSRWHQRVMTLIGFGAFREARRLWGFPRPVLSCPQLSPRKLEILRLAAMGKTDPEIAIILGLARTTIETYMRQLRQGFDVYTRTQLCIVALRFGVLAFEDAMSGF
jgi:DNA-binding CsgD family transcriptional regulator